MGCGKTLTSMMIICDKYKAGKIDSLLVVAPNDVHKQWFDDLCNAGSTLSIALAQEGVSCDGQILGGRGGQKQFYDFDYDKKNLHIVCVNIDTFSQPHKWEPIVEWVNTHNTAIIIDEATSIKNPSSKRSQRMLYEFNDVVKKRNTVLFSGKKPNTVVRCVLTGTPVSNGPMDLWSIMEFIKPNYFNRNYYSFMNYYGMHTKLTVNDRQINVLLTEKTWHGIKRCETYAEAFNTFGCSEDTYLTIQHQDKYLGPYKHADELKELLAPAAVFAKLTDCVDMPACNYIVKEVSLSGEQQEAYDSMQHDLLAEYGDHVSTAKNKMVAAMRLQQISSGFIMGHSEEYDNDAPIWDDDAFDVGPDEVVWLGSTNPRLEQLKRDVAELSKPLLILTRFSAEADKIYNMLKDDYSCMLFTGWKTTGSIEEFKQGKFEIIVANTNKIARGFNLQIAHSTIFYSNTFSMELRQQSEFRTFRMGQKHPCTYIDYVSCGMDKTVLDSLKLKKGLLEYIREKDLREVM
jgi:SNF2 family DNA or RNA helicase